MIIWQLVLMIALAVPIKAANSELKLVSMRNLPESNKIYALAWDQRNDILYGLDHESKQIVILEAKGLKFEEDNKFGLDRVAYTLACDNHGQLWSDEVYTNLIHIITGPDLSRKRIDGRSKFGPFEVIDLYFAGKLLYVLGVKQLRIFDPVVNNDSAGGCGVVANEIGLNTPSDPEELSWCRTLCADSKGNAYILTADSRLITVSGRKDASQKVIPLKVSQTKVDLRGDIPSDCCYLERQKQIVVALPGLKPRLVGLSTKGETLWVHNLSDTRKLEPFTKPPFQPLAVCVRKDTLLVSLTGASNQNIMAVYKLTTPTP